MNQQSAELGQGHLVDGMRLYQPVDPYTLSVTSHVWNNRRRDAINSVDEIGGVPCPPTPFLHSSSGQFNQDTHATDRSSQENPQPSQYQTDTRSTGQNIPLPRVSSVVQKSASTPNTGPGEIHGHEVPAAHSVAFQSRQPVTRYRSLNHKASKRRFTFQSFLSTPNEENKVSTPSSRYYSTPASEEIPPGTYMVALLTTIIPRQVYLRCHLRLPYMYFSRVNQIFEDAHLTMEEIKELAMEDAVQELGLETPDTYLRLKKNWERFIDCLMREWKTLNITSGLLLS